MDCELLPLFFTGQPDRKSVAYLVIAVLYQ